MKQTDDKNFFKETCSPKNFNLFKTESNESYVTLEGVTYPVLGSEFKNALNHRYYEQFEFFPCKCKLKATIEKLDMFAKLYGETKPVYYRFAHQEDALYLDLGNPQFEIVKITGDNVSIITDPPVKFVRSKIQREIEAPVIKEDADALNFLKKYIPFKTDEDHVLFVSWLLACMNPHGGYPPLFLIGEQGAAKSTTTAFVKKLLDPSSLPLRNLSKSMKELMIAASNDFILCYDNISKITGSQSDNLCKLATGAGFSTRKLYTTTEEVQLSCKRPVIINTINYIPTRQDLLDRSIIVRLNFIRPEDRKTDRALSESWTKDRPLILGALCYATSASIRNYNQVEENNLPRMADFAKWVIGAEERLPWEKGVFLETIQNSRAKLVEDAVEAEPVAMAIVKLMADRESWRDTPSKLLDKLEDLMFQDRSKYPNWPKIPNQLSNKLGRISAFLREKGIQVERRHSGQRFIEISKVEVQADKKEKHERNDMRERMKKVSKVFSPASYLSEKTETEEEQKGEKGLESFNSTSAKDVMEV